MAFWSNFFQFQSNFEAIIETLLESPNEYTLDKLLDEEEIIQETKNNHEKLVEYLTRPESLQKLFVYLTVEPSKDADMKRRFKYPYVACEIIFSDVPSIIHSILNQTELIDSLFNFFEKPHPLFPSLSTYVSKVMIVLMKNDIDKMLEYMKARKDFLNNVLQQIDNSSMMELLLKIISSESDDALQYLVDSQLPELLISKFDTKVPSATHEHTSQVLIDIIILLHSLSSTTNGNSNNNFTSTSSNQQSSNVLLTRLESQENMKSLFGFVMNEEGNESSTENGLKVLNSLLEFHINANYDSETTIESLPPFLKTVVSQLPNIYTLLTKKSGKKLTMSFGELEPLGFQKLKVVEFFAILTHTNFQCIYKEMMRLGIIKSCVDLFFDYPWNNFLHSTVEWLIQGVLLREGDELKLHLFQECKLLEQVCNASKLNEEETSKPKGKRRGYMGHITSISLGILGSASNSATIEKILSENEQWKSYIEGPLQSILLKEGRDINSSLSDSKEDESKKEDMMELV